MADERLNDNQRYVDEGVTSHFYVTLGDDTGTVLPLATVATITLSVWWVDTKGKNRSINGRNAQNVLNVNNGTFAATSGLFDWYAQTLDNTMQSTDPGVTEENHYFRVSWTYTSTPGTRSGSYEDYYVLRRKEVLSS